MAKQSAPEQAAPGSHTREEPRSPQLPLLRPLLRTLSDHGIERIRADFPGWDVYALKAEFDGWIGQEPAREPKDYEAAFYGFVKQHHHRNQHQLRG